MDEYFKRNKQVLRKFLQEQYGDEELAILLAHAQEGNLRYHSCCCFIGVATITQANHAVGKKPPENDPFEPLAMANHYSLACSLPNAKEAEDAFYNLIYPRLLYSDWERGDAFRRRIIIPMVKAEIRRRDRVKALAQEWKQEEEKCREVCK